MILIINCQLTINQNFLGLPKELKPDSRFVLLSSQGAVGQACKALIPSILHAIGFDSFIRTVEMDLLFYLVHTVLYGPALGFLRLYMTKIGP